MVHLLMVLLHMVMEQQPMVLALVVMVAMVILGLMEIQSGGPVAGFVSGPPGAPRTPWSNQAPSGYGSAGYGSNAAYGGAGPWSSPVTGGGQVPGHGAHSQGAQAGYGNQGYGFVGYNGTEAPYGNQSGYGVSGVVELEAVYQEMLWVALENRGQLRAFWAEGITTVGAPVIRMLGHPALHRAVAM
ncbi:hypothetical protein HPP92_022496 [Vanilla planifolia]|uniref:Uncharacterized protein n=1 Tax=Vanilla planifolia TaxID=51239 RepID=A0A835PPS6_VANPL|nr:hypothetical protein HPP92_022496 [Vanilla planifolia]